MTSPPRAPSSVSPLGSDFVVELLYSVLLIGMVAHLSGALGNGGIDGIVVALIPVIACGCLLWSLLVDPTRVLVLAGFILAFSLVFILQPKASDQVTDAFFRYSTSLLMLFLGSFAPIRTRRVVFASLSFIVLAAAIIFVLRNGTTVYAGTTRFAMFWDGPHSSALCIGALTIVFFLAVDNKQARLILVGICLILLIGYRVTTAQLMVGFFFLGQLFNSREWNRYWLVPLGLVFITGAAVSRDSTAAVTVSNTGLAALGSGRVDSWVERFTTFAARNPAEQALGTGAYTDYVKTTLWWWEEKNAHSDLITLLMEFGWVGLMSALALGLFLYKRSGRNGQTVLLAVIIGTSISNALLDRPLVAGLWGLALYVAASTDYDSVRKRKDVT